MKDYILIHKYCGMTTIITGYTYESALEESGLDKKIWKRA